MAKADTYAGYKPYHLRESLFPWPPQSGTRKELDEKFHAPHRADAPPDASLQMGSTYHVTTSNVMPGDYEVPTRKLGLQVLVMEKPTVGASMMSGVFVDAPALVGRARSVPADALEDAAASLDARGDGFLLLSEVREGLSRAYAAAQLGEPEEPLVATVVALFTREGRVLKDGSTVVPREQWVRGLAVAADLWEEDLALGRPEILAKSGSLREKAAAARVVGVPPPRKLAAPAPPRLSVPPGSPARTASAQKSAPSTPRADPLAPLGDGLVQGTDGLLQLSPRASRTRALTVEGAGAGAHSPRALGLKVGALREAALAGELALSGRMPSSPSAAAENFKLGGPNLTTSNMRDFGLFGSDPCEIPVHAPSIAGHPANAQELMAGTTRSSQHPPGYTGTLPLYDKGPMAEQGLGAHKRDVVNMKNNMCVERARCLQRKFGGRRLTLPPLTRPPPPTSTSQRR